MRRWFFVVLGLFFEYQIIRLSIPASQADSTMTFRTSNGSIETIATADYGFIGTYCIEENSFSGNYNLYQRIQFDFLFYQVFKVKRLIF